MCVGVCIRADFCDDEGKSGVWGKGKIGLRVRATTFLRARAQHSCFSTVSPRGHVRSPELRTAAPSGLSFSLCQCFRVNTFLFGRVSEMLAEGEQKVD